MKSLKRIFIMGVLSLASFVMFIGQTEAKGAPSGTIKTYRMVTTDQQAIDMNNDGGLFVKATIMEMNSLAPIGTIAYNYNETTPENLIVPVEICFAGKPCYTTIIPATPEGSTIGVNPYTPNLVANFYSAWHEQVGNPSKVCRCVNEHAPRVGIQNVPVLGLEIPPIKDAILQIADTDLIDQLF